MSCHKSIFSPSNKVTVLRTLGYWDFRVECQSSTEDHLCQIGPDGAPHDCGGFFSFNLRVNEWYLRIFRRSGLCTIESVLVGATIDLGLGVASADCADYNRILRSSKPPTWKIATSAQWLGESTALLALDSMSSHKTHARRPKSLLWDKT